MGSMFFIIALVFAVIWAVRIEVGINKLNATAQKIEKHLSMKGDKK